MALAPISFGNKAIAQTFEKLFEGDSYVPYLYADINDDGKQEYVLYGKWRTLAGKELYSFPEGSAIWPSAMLYLTANPVPGFVITANDYEDIRGDVIFIKDGKYVISNVYSKAYNVARGHKVATSPAKTMERPSIWNWTTRLPVK